MSPPQTPSKPRKQEIIDLDSSPEQGPLPSTSTLTPAPPPESPLTRARAQIVYGSPASRGALSPSKPHPFHQSPVHPSFLDKGKQPDFTASRADRLKQGESVVYPLHRPHSPNKTISSERVKKFRGELPVRDKTDDKENEPAIRRIQSGSCAGTGATVGKGKGKGKAAAGCGLKEFNLADDEWGKPPMIVYSRSREEVEELVGCLKGPLSFDMEWPISRKKGHECKTALVQVGDARMILLVQISAMYYKIPPGLLKILCDPNVIKLGVNIRGDALKLRRDFGHKMRGFLEVSHMARGVDPLSTGPGKAIISLANLTAHYLVRHLPKPALRTGDWTAQLSKEAIAYAAADVLSALLIYRRLAGILEKAEGLPSRERLDGWIGDLWQEEVEEKEKLARDKLEQE